MEYRSTRLPAGVRRSEPSWPTVIATTVRLWVQRNPVFGSRSTRRRRVTVVLAAVAVVVLGAGVAGAVVWHAATPSSAPSASAGQRQAAPPDPGSTAALGVSAAVRSTAASWIAGQVASSAVIACDPAMCAALQADGIAATRLVVLGTATADPLGSDLVVATAAVRNEFGARLESVYAPALVASFGSGAEKIDIRAVAPDGAAAYESSLAADRRSRVSAGSQLLHNPRISVSASARAALSAGDVDPRLLLMLAALAAGQPVAVTAFGDAAPGAGTAVPLRSARLAPGTAGTKASSATAPAAGAKSQLRSMLAYIEAQQGPYLPLRAGLDGTSALTVEYAAPSPLGLLSGP
jgi:hypothetical protein